MNAAFTLIWNIAGFGDQAVLVRQEQERVAGDVGHLRDHQRPLRGSVSAVQPLSDGGSPTGA